MEQFNFDKAVDTWGKMKNSIVLCEFIIILGLFDSFIIQVLQSLSNVDLFVTCTVFYGVNTFN